MNERIRKLAEQAFFDDATCQPSDRMYTFSDHKMQKFAEIIIFECVKLAVFKGNAETGRAIKQHFGVK